MATKALSSDCKLTVSAVADAKNYTGAYRTNFAGGANQITLRKGSKYGSATVQMTATVSDPICKVTSASVSGSCPGFDIKNSMRLPVGSCY